MFISYKISFYVFHIGQTDSESESESELPESYRTPDEMLRSISNLAQKIREKSQSPENECIGKF